MTVPRVVKKRLVSAQTITATTQSSGVEIGHGKTRLTTTAKAASVSGTTPSYTVAIEGSYNGSDWFALHAHTALTAAGYNKAESSESQGGTASSIPPFIRANITVSGTTPSAVVTVEAIAE